MNYTLETYKIYQNTITQVVITNEIFPHLNHVYHYVKQLDPDIKFNTNGSYLVGDTLYIAKPYFEYTADKFTDKKNRVWEIFIDSSYYDMACVRQIGDKNFNSIESYHFPTLLDAHIFASLLKSAD